MTIPRFHPHASLCANLSVGNLIAARRLVHSIVLVEAERLHAHFPIPVGPGYAVTMELGIGFGANFPLIDDANVGGGRHLRLDRLVRRTDPGVSAPLPERHAFRPLPPPA